MICPNCNQEIADDSIFCPGCGCKIGEKQSEIKKQKAKQANIKYVAIIIAVVIVAVGGGILIYVNSTPEAKYNKAEKAFRNNDYGKAKKYYAAAGDYQDAEEKLKKAETAYHYENGLDFIAEGNYDGAKEELALSEGYKDTFALLQQCEYNIALAYLTNGDYENAAMSFGKAGDYEDADEKIFEIGKQLVEAEDYSAAVAIYNYSENWSKDSYAEYANGMVYLDAEKYSDAAECFDKAGGVLDASDRFNEAEYHYANEQLASRNYSDAEAAFKKVSGYLDADELANACELMLAKENMEAGKLNAAKAVLKRLPSDYSYNGVEVSSLLKKLDDNSEWVAVCGRWSNTSGEAETHCRARNYNYDGGTWTSTFNNGDYSIEIKCVLNNDGTVSVTGTGTIMVFTNWSSIQMGLDYDTNYSINFNKRIKTSDFGSKISINDDTTITLGTDKITLNYRYSDNNSVTSFVYTYTTNVTYGRKTTAY